MVPSLGLRSSPFKHIPPLPFHSCSEGSLSQCFFFFFLVTTCRWYKSLIDFSSRGPLALCLFLLNLSIWDQGAAETPSKNTNSSYLPLSLSSVFFLNQCLLDLSSLLPSLQQLPTWVPWNRCFLMGWSSLHIPPPCVMYNWDLWLGSFPIPGGIFREITRQENHRIYI